MKSTERKRLLILSLLINFPLIQNKQPANGSLREQQLKGTVEERYFSI